LAACHTVELTDESSADESPASSRRDAILRIPERRRDDVGHGRYGWAGLGPHRELSQVRVGVLRPGREAKTGSLS
jgi:hypothetical protein